MCGKITYPTKDQALIAISGSQNDKRPSKTGAKLQKSYYCNECQGWHTSRQKGTSGHVIHFKKPKEFKFADKKLHEQSQRQKPLIIRNFTHRPI